MKDYRSFTVEDFLTDPLFRAWVLDKDEQAKTFWNSWSAENQDKTAILREAAAMLYTLSENDIISDDEVENRIASTLHLIREERDQQSPGKINWLRIGASIAAILCITIGIRWFLTTQPRNTTGDVREVSYSESKSDIFKRNNSHEADTVKLEDGSFVVLQPTSELQYPAKFSEANRIVHLKGEGFFEISKDTDRPFFVFANDLITKVLGTSFTVTAYEKENRTLVSVRTGRVSVFLSKDRGAAKKINSREIAGMVLTPNQQVVYEKQDERLHKRIVEEPVIIADVAKLSFEERPVKEIFTALEQAYGIELMYDEKVLSNCLLTANLSEVSLYEGLDLICKILPASYEIMDGKVIIYSKGCKTMQ